MLPALTEGSVMWHKGRTVVTLRLAGALCNIVPQVAVAISCNTATERHPWEDAGGEARKRQLNRAMLE